MKAQGLSAPKTPPPSFEDAARDAEGQVGAALDLASKGDMGPLELALFTEASNRVNRQFELASRVMKGYDDAANSAIANLK